MTGCSCGVLTSVIIIAYIAGLTAYSLFGIKIPNQRGKNMKAPRDYKYVKNDYDIAWGAVKRLTPIDNTDFDADLVTQSNILNQLAEEMSTNPPVAGGAVTQIQIGQLKSDIATALNKSEMFICTLRDNRKLHYQEAGQWARHFSTIRMTVMTLTVTTCVGIVAWKGQLLFSKGSVNDLNLVRIAAVIPVTILWIAGVGVFALFSVETYKQIDRQQIKRPFLPSSCKDNDVPNRRRFDWASLAVALLNLIMLGIGIWKFNFCYAVNFILLCLILFGLYFPCGLWRMNRKE